MPGRGMPASRPWATRPTSALLRVGLLRTPVNAATSASCASTAATMMMRILEAARPVPADRAGAASVRGAARAVGELMAPPNIFTLRNVTILGPAAGRQGRPADDLRGPAEVTA